MADTVEVPSASDASDEFGGAVSPMIEGAAVGAGTTIGGAVLPVAGEAAGGYASSLFLSRESAKTYANRRAAEKAMDRLLE